MTHLLLASNLRDFAPKLDQVFDRPLKDMEVVCIPTAAAGEDNPDSWLVPEKAALRDRVKSFTEFDLRGKTPEKTQKALDKADIIYVTGGNTYFLLEHVQKSSFAEALKPCLERGAWYVGASAGTVLACPDIDYIRAMDKPDRAHLTDFTGLNLVDALVIPHADHPKYGPIAEKIMADIEHQPRRVIPLHDHQALVVRGAGMEIL